VLNSSVSPFSLAAFALLVLTIAAYWIIRTVKGRQLLLIAASYVFCGFIHPWFCIVLGFSTGVVIGGTRLLARESRRPKLVLGCSVAALLAPLLLLKYSAFIVASIGSIVSLFGTAWEPSSVSFLLPIGISFYTLQGIGLLVDVYRRPPERPMSLLSVAAFMAFFPRLAAGPIERGDHLIPQLESRSAWRWSHLDRGAELIILGLLKKLVVADNIAVLVDRIFLLKQPSLWPLLVGAVGFTIQILADFSGYTDLARGAARLFGIDLLRNFRAPYVAVSPSDFWRRWHISLSTWIRDYIYIPMGGSRVPSRVTFLFIMLGTMAISGLWHGAGWTFVVWGLYHGILLFAYHRAGAGGRWRPKSVWGNVCAWSVMTAFTVFGWLLFRAPSLSWLCRAFVRPTLGLSGDAWLAGLGYVGMIALYTLPLAGVAATFRLFPTSRLARGLVIGAAVVAIVVLAQDATQDFVYFRF